MTGSPIHPTRDYTWTTAIMYACSECGAAIPATHVEMHDHWHDGQSEAASHRDILPALIEVTNHEDTERRFRNPATGEETREPWNALPE